MLLFAKRIYSALDVEAKLDMIDDQNTRDEALRANPYLGKLVNEHAVLFETSRTLRSGRPQDDRLKRSIKSGFAGMVAMREAIPGEANPYAMAVALPIKGTHDNRAYVSVKVSAYDIDTVPLYGEEEPVVREHIARKAAGIAIHGYLTDTLESQNLYAAEDTTDVLSALMRHRR